MPVVEASPTWPISPWQHLVCTHSPPDRILEEHPPWEGTAGNPARLSHAPIVVPLGEREAAHPPDKKGSQAAMREGGGSSRWSRSPFCLASAGHTALLLTIATGVPPMGVGRMRKAAPAERRPGAAGQAPLRPKQHNTWPRPEGSSETSLWAMGGPDNQPGNGPRQPSGEFVTCKRDKKKKITSMMEGLD